jgi:hypothetical protein
VLGTHSLDELHAASWIVPSLEEVVVTAKADGLDMRFVPAAYPVA